MVGNMLEMHSRQKTFSVALSRDMVPSARIVAYAVHESEVVADALNFFVNGTRQNPVSGMYTCTLYLIFCSCQFKKKMLQANWPLSLVL